MSEYTEQIFRGERHTFMGEPRSTVPLSGNGQQLPTVDQVRALATTQTITGAGLITGGGDLSDNRTLTVAEASDAEMDAATSGSVAVTPRRFATRLSSWWSAISSAAQSIPGQWSFTGEPRSTASVSGNGSQLLNSDQVRALTTQYSITGGGLATGGGNLAANRSIFVGECTMPDMDAGTTGSYAVTPRRLAYRLPVWWSTILSAAQSITGQWTFSGEPRSTAPLSGNGTQLTTQDQVISTIRLQSGAIPGSDAVTNPSKYTSLRALGVPSGRAQGIPGVSDELLNGWVSAHNSSLIFHSNLGGFACTPPSTVGACCGLSILPAAAITNGIYRSDFQGKVNIACQVSGGWDANALQGRRFYFGFGNLTTGSSTTLTKGNLGIGWGGFSDYLQFWNGSVWTDTTLRWKDSSSSFQKTWDFQILSASDTFTLQARQSSATGAWTTIGTLAHNGYALGYYIVLANIAEGPALSPANSAAYFTVTKLHYATNM